MLDDAYATPAEYTKAKAPHLSSDGWPELERQLVSVSRWLDVKLNQPYGFNKDTVATTRVYRPNEQIAPIATTTDLVVKVSSGTAIDWGAVGALTLNTDFELEPLNPRLGWPYSGIRLLTSWPYHINPKTYHRTEYRVQVTAIHGWPEVPSQITDATIELTAMALRGESIFTTDRINESMDASRAISPQARGIFKSLYETFNQYPVAVA